MAASAWVGGGAPAFSKALTEHRTTMQRAFQDAAEQIATRIRQEGGQAPQVPSFSTPMSVMSATHNGFDGMDIAKMERLVTDLHRAAQQLPDAGHRLSGELSAMCVPAASGAQVAAAGDWARSQVNDLRTRLSVIQKDPGSTRTTTALTAFGLFGTHAPDPGGVTKLTTAASNGDPKALQALVNLQNTGKDATLASRLNVWWQQLSPTTQQSLLSQRPQLIGSLNGLPAATRDQANRAYLEGAKVVLDEQINELRALPYPGLVSRTMKDTELKRRQLASVETALALGGKDGRPPAYLLQLELGDRGKTAISYGNPDEADNIVTYVPGTDTKLDGFGGSDAKRAAYLWNQANSSAPNKKIASIAWLGYEPPQWGETHSSRHTVLNRSAAEAGAPLLASFTDGLHAAHKAASDVRLSVLGHSYGSTVVGLATQQRFHGFADQVIFVGSPGVGVDTARQLGVGSVWVGEAPNDPVGDLGKASPITPLGKDPSGKEFGAHHFYVPDNGASTLSFKGHSSYWGDTERGWDQFSPAMQNLGLLVNGQYEDLTRAPKHTEPTPPPRLLAPGPLPVSTDDIAPRSLT
ncbi:alpha/beta hydrolase [Sphaerisporangium krabiense]|uniref:DUF1023 domain-containing protein n=1 Tax=Sphaerisporangium krabiense TaxID=763782 RepID=A0A7W8Z1D3_9ACTN|nr:alpha/beta hydrolase [Sphaerisporangium krabiense]MBB5625683.1 hypothetical protein [Sphaerisporangium krabiense]